MKIPDHHRAHVEELKRIMIEDDQYRDVPYAELFLLVSFFGVWPEYRAKKRASWIVVPYGIYLN